MKDIKISILILTHKRPELFKRCINSVITAYNKFPTIHGKVEILVNNDSDDIDEIYSIIPTSYSYNKFNLGNLHKDIFERANGEYIYFVGDDDYISEDFFEIFSQYNEDIMYFNYNPWEWDKRFIDFFKYTNKKYKDKNDFLKNFNSEHFLFGQICFKKKCLNDFPITDDIENDFLIFKRLNGSFININKFIYTQTIDGGDNISFKKD